MPADFAQYLWELFTDERLITILFTLLVLGGTCFALSVMPRWQEEEAARAVTPTPVEEIRKAA